MYEHLMILFMIKVCVYKGKKIKGAYENYCFWHRLCGLSAGRHSS